MKYKKQIKELIDGLTTKYPTTMSCVLTCPQCREYNTLQCEYFGNTHIWRCLVKICSFTTKEIPSIKEMETLFKLNQQLKDLKRYGLIFNK